MNEIRKCPHCGGESNGILSYGKVIQTFCDDCHKPYTIRAKVEDETKSRKEVVHSDIEGV